MVAITEGLMDHSKAFTMNALGPWEVWGLTKDSFGSWLAKAEARRFNTLYQN